MQGDEVDPVAAGRGAGHELVQPASRRGCVVGHRRAAQLHTGRHQLRPQAEGLRRGHVRLAAHVRLVEAKQVRALLLSLAERARGHVRAAPDHGHELHPGGSGDAGRGATRCSTSWRPDSARAWVAPLNAHAPTPFFAVVAAGTAAAGDGVGGGAWRPARPGTGWSSAPAAPRAGPGPERACAAAAAAATGARVVQVDSDGAAGHGAAGHHRGRRELQLRGRRPVARACPGRGRARAGRPVAAAPGRSGGSSRPRPAAGRSGSPASSRSAGTRPAWWAPHRRQSRMCRAMRLRHSGPGTPSQPAMARRQAGARRARRAAPAPPPGTVVSCSFIRATRTATCSGGRPSARRDLAAVELARGFQPPQREQLPVARGRASGWPAPSPRAGSTGRGAGWSGRRSRPRDRPPRRSGRPRARACLAR